MELKENKKKSESKVREKGATKAFKSKGKETFVREHD